MRYLNTYRLFESNNDYYQEIDRLQFSNEDRVIFNKTDISNIINLFNKKRSKIANLFNKSNCNPFIFKRSKGLRNDALILLNEKYRKDNERYIKYSLDMDMDIRLIMIYINDIFVCNIEMGIDEWYYLRIPNEYNVTNMFNFKCDQWDGLVKCLKDKNIIR